MSACPSDDALLAFVLRRGLGAEASASMRGTAAAYGRIQAGLESKGTPIGTLDTLIAAHAFALNVTLVTNNQKHVSKVRGLKVANWSEGAG